MKIELLFCLLFDQNFLYLQNCSFLRSLGIIETGEIAGETHTPLFQILKQKIIQLMFCERRTVKKNGHCQPQFIHLAQIHQVLKSLGNGPCTLTNRPQMSYLSAYLQAD